ncbi:MAG: hypothetical protein M0D55_01905 [Elusimicrobiota bacterium]|nr:MAG: hypothetical protein M0D55_01905 [Elusimicrobiota bacterium]
MKAFKEVESTRRQYHAKPALNSVHRSSLLVPELPGAVAEISFVNHFLLKRKYPHVGLRVTGIDAAGKRVESRLFPVTEPRVHVFKLTGLFDKPVADYLVEFYAAENLFIPFPAVMVNHRGPGFLNTLHSYNRSLNDVFEDDSINAKPVAEASIDVLPAPLQAFLLFTAGPSGGRGELELELATPEKTWTAKVSVDSPRFGHRLIKIREAFPGLPASATGVLKARQPAQPMFYGRMLCGHLDAQGRFTANHSYYDSSSAAEYWDDARESYRSYPYFPGIDNRIRMYPIMSPSELTVTVSLRGADGRELAKVPAGSVTSPGPRFLDVSVGALAAKAGVAEAAVAAYTVATAGSKMPTRVNHQLVHGSGGLESSINVSLVNPNVFQPAGKTGLTWGQFPAGKGLRSRLGIVGNAPAGEACPVEVTFYGEDGELGKVEKTLAPGGSVLFDSKDFETRGEEPSYLWFFARSSRPDLSAFVVTRDDSTGACTGEHGF